MKTKSSLHEKNFAPGTSRNRESSVTLRLQSVMEEADLLAMGARIAELRETTGLGQKAIADYCGVELRTYQFWQEGKHPPGGERLQKLAELFRSRGVDYATESYILKGPTPALFGLSGDEARAQLDRIERKVDEILKRLSDPSQEDEPPGVAEPPSAPPPEPPPSLEPTDPGESTSGEDQHELSNDEAETG